MRRYTGNKGPKTYEPRMIGKYGDHTVDAFQKQASMELVGLNSAQMATVTEMIAHHRVTGYIQLEGIAEQNWRHHDIRGEGFDDPELFDSLCARDDYARQIYRSVKERAAKIREQSEEGARMSPL